MSTNTYMVAKCPGCLKVVAAEVFQNGESTVPFYEEYEGSHIVEASQTIPMLDGCQCKAELTRLRAANAKLVSAMQTLISSCGSIQSEAIAKARAAISRAEQAKPETCAWKAVSNPLNEEEWYETECKNTSTDIGKFCLHCGKRVEVEE